MKSLFLRYFILSSLLWARESAAFVQGPGEVPGTAVGTGRVAAPSESSDSAISDSPAAKPGSGNASTPSRVYRNRRDGDAILELNLCAGANESMLPFITNKKRNWNYFKVTENARMIICGINPEKEKLSVNTIGLVNVYVVESSPLAILGLTPPAASEQEEEEEPAAPPAPLSAEKKREAEDEITKNMKVIEEYIKALQERRRRITAQACFNQQELDATLEAPVRGVEASRFRLQINQERAMDKLPVDNSVREEAEAQLKELETELNKWLVLRGGNLILGPPIPVRDKDYIRFEVKRKDLATNTEVTLPHYDIPVYGNFRINVSSGLIFNRLVDHSFLAVNEDLADPTLASDKVSDPPKKVPVRENTPNVVLGLGALVHFYHTSHWAKGNLAPAVSVGATLNADGKYSGMLGGSLIIGGAQRLVLTTGLSIGQVARLKKPYEENKAYSFTDAEFPMTTETKSGWFFGVTWNLSANRNPVPN